MSRPGPSGQAELDIRASRLVSTARRIWGDPANTSEWLNNSHPELGGASPASLLRTEEGCMKVEALLGALEFGFPV
jgi:putative toxin-antitoxin system antitoxin component (TIGR02293 family)